MLTLKQDPGNTIVCHIRSKGSKKRTPVYYHPVVKDSLRNSVDSLSYFFEDPMFRDSFELNQEEANEIRSCMEKGGVCTRFQKKYFRVKRHIQDHLNESMDLQGTGEKFEVLFPDKCDSYGWCHLYNGGTGSGKTHALKMKIETNLNQIGRAHV